MWCGASASTRIHETVRHTWRFDFDSSNSFSVVLSSAVWNMSSRKKSVFVWFCFCSSLFFSFFCASLPCLSLFWGSVLLLLLLLGCFFFFSGEVCFISQAIWLVSEPNFFSCITVLPPLADSHTYVHTFPQTDTLPSHSKQINASLAAIGTPKLTAALKMCRLLLMFLVHDGSRCPGPDSPTSLRACVFLLGEEPHRSGSGPRLH